MIVVFGRPGAGKTTISRAAVRSLGDGGDGGRHRLLHLDLDVCVPRWMRENFSKGIYPTPQQRAEFISAACDHVREEIASAAKDNGDVRNPLVTIVSFSFVNTDLRAAYRVAFPHARWILVDTDERLCEERISAREGHFYKNAPNDGQGEDDDDGAAETGRGRGGGEADDDENSEWEFRPVDFPHVALDGRDAAEANAARIAECVERLVAEEEEEERRRSPAGGGRLGDASPAPTSARTK